MVGKGRVRWLGGHWRLLGAAVLLLGLVDVTWVCSLCDNSPSHTLMICLFFLITACNHGNFFQADLYYKTESLLQHRILLQSKAAKNSTFREGRLL